MGVRARPAWRCGWVRSWTAAGWQPLWVPRGAEREAAGAVRTVGQPCVLVVDYAETRSELVGLVDDMAADREARRCGWCCWRAVPGSGGSNCSAGAEGQAAALLEAYAPVVLGPVRAAGGPQEIFAEALAAFAEKLGMVRPDVPLVVV